MDVPKFMALLSFFKQLALFPYTPCIRKFDAFGVVLCLYKLTSLIDARQANKLKTIPPASYLINRDVE
jgi:hypothetical protein